MKIVITEQQLRLITEQSVIGASNYGTTDNGKKLYGDGAPPMKLSYNMDMDDIIDIVSGMIDVIPGIGNLVSGGIDITHGIAYIVRFFLSQSVEDKAEMGVMALVTLGTSFIPIGGNVTDIAIRAELKTLMKKTPHEILVTAKSMGLIKKIPINLSKDVWKYSIMVALIKIFRSSFDNVIGSAARTIASLSNKSKQLKPYMDDFVKELQDIQTIKKSTEV
jgi:hypothetical protein